MLFWKQDSISAHPFELAQTLNFKNHINILASYPFFEIELENEYDPELQLGNTILLPNSKMTPVSSPDFNPFSESVLGPVPVLREIESPIFYDHHIEIDQFHTFESSLTNWQVLIFMKLNSMRNITSILKFVIQIKFLNQY